MDLRATTDALRGLIANVELVISGKPDAVTLAAAALFADVHLLVEDVPGVGKTMLARAVARSMDASFKRIQGTPDLLPSDITGSSVWNQSSRTFEFVPGPVFANVVLVDEINRATPKAQSALLEVMEENRVSCDGQTYDLPRPHFVIATLNPVEHHGTFPLPEGELDRFGLAIRIGYPDEGTERTIVRSQMEHHPIDDLDTVLGPDELIAHRAAVRLVHVSEAVLDYALTIVRRTREHAGVRLGASPRGSLALTRCAQALALVHGRDFVGPEDVQALAGAALAHRISPLEARAADPDAARRVVDDIVGSTEVPVLPRRR